MKERSTEIDINAMIIDDEMDESSLVFLHKVGSHNFLLIHSHYYYIVLHGSVKIVSGYNVQGYTT